MSERMVAFHSAPSLLPTKIQFFLLCGAPHNRKNYLFAGSDKGAKRLAIGYTIFGSCRIHGANPLTWATDVIGKLQAGWPRERLHELLPDAWASSSRAAPTTGDADAT
ncbi:transposase domain-containing protein [Sorangium sp. wiwo2]|uniref:Transposase domain-containing protein n=1 Tax=Sorangium atrum TaxID=2995308 RepID=A0ABT5BXV8_9BACT|nr:transposase domain-containing protein [Sorangium aterium]MDC0678992.1 transposase domain-containing protein [Sorangium aterium]